MQVMVDREGLQQIKQDVEHLSDEIASMQITLPNVVDKLIRVNKNVVAVIEAMEAVTA